MNDEKLISIVECYRELYDPSESNYSNQERRDNIWQEIDEKMGVKGDECRKRWSQIRNNFRKHMVSMAKNSTEIRKGQAGIVNKPWRLERQIEFLKPFLPPLNQTNDSLAEDDGSSHSAENFSATCITPSSPTSRSKGSKRARENQEESSAAMLRNYIEFKTKRKPADHLTHFFKFAEETVRAFPKELQVEAKKRCYDILSEFEFKALNIWKQNSVIQSPPLPTATNVLSNATPNFSNATPNFSNATPNFSNATPNFSNATPNFSNATPNFFFLPNGQMACFPPYGMPSFNNAQASLPSSNDKAQK